LVASAVVGMFSISAPMSSAKLVGCELKLGTVAILTSTTSAGMLSE
jgi:hypothetical protein